jgi:membrane associated rhomboid family serine protease
LALTLEYRVVRDPRELPMLIIPYHVDVPMRRPPLANFALLGLTSLISLVALGGKFSGFDAWILDRENGLSGYLGHMFLHVGILHLAGNMLFLWVFGNAVCAKVGNLWYPVIYLGLGLSAGVVHTAADHHPAIGASGAINGVVGMYVVWYARNYISCAWLWFGRAGFFAVSSGWMILLWLAFDIWGAAAGGGSVAYFAHLGGFFAGFGLAALLLVTGLVQKEEGEETLFDLFRSEADQASKPRLHSDRPTDRTRKIGKRR